MSLKRVAPLSLSRAAAQTQFRSRLLAWFQANARDLPWRRTRDPYAIWVSEIMLQQTRVAAVLEKYAVFLSRFPNVNALAASDEPDVLAVWSGLGYYRRARRMLRAARVVVDEHDSLVPSTAAGLRELPGIGSYTSAAIASIAFGEAVAVVDGNVERVIMRLVGWGEEIPGSKETQPSQRAQKMRHPASLAGQSDGSESASTQNPIAPRYPMSQKRDMGHPLLSLKAAAVQQQASRLLDPARPGDFNQAMMELGATICLPRAPLCLQCPVFDYCLTRGEHVTSKRSPMRSKDVAFALALRKNKGGKQVLLEQRAATNTVMGGMWEMPALDPLVVTSGRVVLTLRHAIMQTNYVVSVAAVKDDELPPSIGARRQWFGAEQLATLPLTGLARKVLITRGLFAIKQQSTEPV